MKAETRNGYIKRHDLAIQKIKQLMVQEEVESELMEKYQKLFERGREIAEIIYESESATLVSNKLQSFEGRVINACGGIFTTPKDEMEEPQEGSLGKNIIDMVALAQTALLDAYAMAINANPMASDVPAIGRLQAEATVLTGIMNDLSRVKGLML